MPAPDPESPEAFEKEVRNSLLKGFTIPLLLLAFYFGASSWLNHNLHTEVAKSIRLEGRLEAEQKARLIERYGQVDFDALCGAVSPRLPSLRAQLDESGICFRFKLLHLGFRLSFLLVAILAVTALAVRVLNRRARRSGANLIPSYRLAWRLSIAAAMAQILILLPLLAYASFELMVLATDRYVTKLILFSVVAGLIGLAYAVSVLFRKVPLEFATDMARAVTPDEAPELWADVRAAAARIGTTPPDHILMGMDYNFYVTELAVTYRDGRTGGRTLYLSHPLMQQLGADEVLSIIGHELGHFRGDDTRLTREFYPMRFKVEATLHAMTQAAWVGWTSVHTLLFFRNSFGATEQAMSRERELLADRISAELTTPEIAARALTKIHIFSEAFGRKLQSGTANPFATQLPAYVRNEMAAEAPFWDQLFEHKSPHPLDSHPSLRVRLQALGQPVDADHAKTIAIAETTTAHTRWFSGRDALFTGITQEAIAAVSRLNAKQADYTTDEGKKLLEIHFPKIRWRARASSLWFKVVLYAICAITALGIAVVLPKWQGRLFLAILATGLVLAIVQQWRRHRGGEFVLRVDSLTYTGWHRPLVFADLASFNPMNSSGTFSIMFHLKERAPGIWKWSPLNWWRARTVNLPMGLIAGKEIENLETLLRYLTRQA